MGEWQLGIGTRKLSLTNLEWRGLKVSYTSNIVGNCWAEVWDVVLDSGFVNSY
jgi:hypothetical protein